MEKTKMATPDQEKPQPLKFKAFIEVPQDTLEDQQNTPSAAQLQSDLQAGIDADTTYTQGTVIKVEQIS
jgi:hypothetical protein